MNYRVRDTNTGELVKHCELLLSPCGTRILTRRGCELFRVQGFKPEFEVSCGVYEGDYVLTYQVDVPSVYHIKSLNEVNVVGTNIKYSGDAGRFLVGVDFEVIKCR